MTHPPPSDHLLDPVADRDHALGDERASITVVVYGDYECPFTRLAHSGVLRARAALGGDVRYVFRHFPLRDVHPHAQHAAEAAEAAGAQGWFWDMHDRLFRYQHALSDPDLVAH